jgi:phage gp16-like protein
MQVKGSRQETKGKRWKPTDRWLARIAEQRRGLLAKIHIAKKELGLTPDQYEAVLSGFKVESARDLTIPQLESMVKYLKYLGWRPYRRRKRQPVEKRITALQDRCRELAGQIENGSKRLAGLVKSKGDVDTLEWLRDTAKLKQILVIMEKYKKQQQEEGRTYK